MIKEYSGLYNMPEKYVDFEQFCIKNKFSVDTLINKHDNYNLDIIIVNKIIYIDRNDINKIPKLSKSTNIDKELCYRIINVLIKQPMSTLNLTRELNKSVKVSEEKVERHCYSLLKEKGVLLDERNNWVFLGNK